jgi:hypothetical protein
VSQVTGYAWRDERGHWHARVGADATQLPAGRRLEVLGAAAIELIAGHAGQVLSVRCTTGPDVHDYPDGQRVRAAFVADDIANGGAS